jgi:hypothetical protein
MTHKNTVTEDQILNIIAGSEIKAFTLFNKTTVIALQMPNGYVITESSSCVDPANYDPVIGYDACMDRITNKIWELEGYRLSIELYEEKADDEA